MGFVTEKRISAYGAITLEDSLVIAGTYDKQYLADFANPGGGNGIQIRKYATEAASLYEGGDLVLGELTEDFINLVIDRRIYKGVKLTDDEMKLDVVNFNSQVASPLFRSMAEQIEEQCFEEFYKVQHVSEYVSGAPNSVEDITMLSAQADVLNFPTELPRILAIDAITAGRLLSADGARLMDASFGADGGKSLRTGVLGEIAGVNILKSNKIPAKKVSSATEGSATVAIPANKAKTAISVDGLEAGDTLHKGDVLVFTNTDGSIVRVNVSEDYEAVGSGDVVQVFWVDKAVDLGASFTVKNVGFGLLYTPKTFALASYMQEKLHDETDYINDPQSGISIRITKDYKNFDHSLVLDCKFGATPVNRDLGIRVDLSTDAA